MKAIADEMILASAGSGKTYQLTLRFIRILALLNCPPEQIVALTFTRKAAGEFLRRILQRLAQAAADPQKATTLAKEIDVPLTQPDIIRLLRSILLHIDRLNLGTLDGFFNRILQSYPLEFGLGPGFRILDESETLLIREEVLNRVFRSPTDPTASATPNTRSLKLHAPDHAASANALTPERAASANAPSSDLYSEILQWYKEFTWGENQRSVRDVILGVIDRFHSVWMQQGKSGIFQKKDALVEYLYPFPTLPHFESIRDILLTFEPATGDSLVDGKWRDFCHEIQRWQHGREIPSKSCLEFFTTKFCDRFKKDDSTDPWKFRIKKSDGKFANVIFDNEFRKAASDWVQIWVHSELTRQAQSTLAAAGLTESYDRCYDAIVRQSGKLTFADLPVVLRDQLGPERADLAYRLDSRWEHWLLDEFQDTSRLQWQIIAPFVDEAISDAEQLRSFFCVGDPKQSIYSWRGGDSRLFHEILQHYNQGTQPAIHQRSLATSYRTAQPVLDFVNQVFGDFTQIASVLGSPAAASSWEKAFEPHAFALPPQQNPGEVAIYEVDAEESSGPNDSPDSDDQSADKNAARMDAVATWIHNAQPFQRGLTIACLVRNNSEAHEVVEQLRSRHIPASLEGKVFPWTDNSIGVACLSLLQYAAHPTDQLALHHLNSLPLQADQPANPGFYESLPSPHSIRNQIADTGYHATVSRFIDSLPPQSRISPFARNRIQWILRACRQADKAAIHNIDDALRFFRPYALQDAADIATVQVLTVHKAKGLEYDAVLLCMLEGKSLTSSHKDNLYFAESANGQIDWALQLPKKQVCELVPRLETALEEMHSRQFYEDICVLYVAMTRARRGLYIFLDRPQSKSSNAKSYKNWIYQSIDSSTTSNSSISSLEKATCIYQHGQHAWWMDSPLRQTSTQHTPADQSTYVLQGKVLPAVSPLLPSAQKEHEPKIASLFRANSTQAQKLGTTIHRTLAKLETWQPGDNIPSTGNPEWDSLLHTALTRKPLQQALASIPNSEIWRERSFECHIDNDWVSGTFDRVVLTKSANGEWLQATIFDFKTDRIRDNPSDPESVLTERYASQLNLYQTAISSLTGLPPEKITAKAIWTGSHA